MYACVLNIFLVLISRLIFLNTYRRTALVICLHICLNQPLKIQWTIHETKSICWLYLALGMLVITPLLFIYSIIICVYKSLWGWCLYIYTLYYLYIFGASVYVFESSMNPQIQWSLSGDLFAFAHQINMLVIPNAISLLPMCPVCDIYLFLICRSISLNQFYGGKFEKNWECCKRLYLLPKQM